MPRLRAPLSNGLLRKDVRALANMDPIFAMLHQKHGYPKLWARPAGYITLVQTILEQQVSVASGKAVFEKLELQYDLMPVVLATLNDEQFRSCGVSRQKARYIRDLSLKIKEGDLNLEELLRLSDDEAIEALIQVKGIGIWTAECYLMMAMGRRDVCPLGDLAIRQVIEKHWIEDSEYFDLKPKKQLLVLKEISLPWSPFRSAASMLLWSDYLVAE